MQDSTAEQRERLRLRMASMASHEACHAAIASLRRGSFSSQSLTCGTSHVRTFALFELGFEMLHDQAEGRRCNNRGPHGSHGNAERGRGAGCKSWLLKNVIITLITEPPTPALGQYLILHAVLLTYTTLFDFLSACFNIHHEN